MWVDRLEATIEAHTLAAAQVRENCTIPGTSVRTAWLCRDKPSMKEALRAAGVPTAASGRRSTADEVHEFADAVGYPLILKPRTGAGALDTTRVDNKAELDAALGRFGGQGVDSIAVEEFVEGHEGFYDTISVNGHVALDFVSHYFPNVLEAMRTRWISPQFIATNRVDSVADYGELRELGGRVNEALGHRDQRHPHGVVLRPEGPAVLRDRLPPARRGRLGPVLGRATTSTSTASGRTRSCTATSPRARRASSPPASSRCGPDHDGHITGYSGVEDIQARSGEWVIDAHLPPPGTPTQPVEAGYMANAYVRMRHPDYDACADCSTTSAAPCTCTPRE